MQQAGQFFFHYVSGALIAPIHGAQGLGMLGSFVFCLLREIASTFLTK